MVVPGRGRDGIPVPRGFLQCLLQNPAGTGTEEVRSQDLQFRARTRLGQKAGAIPAMDF